MKKLIIALLLFVSVATSYGQGKFHERQNTAYIEAAAKEFNLDGKQQAELSEIRMEMVKAYITSNKSFKADEITKEEKKELTKEASKVYHNKLSKLTGKAYKDMQPWLKKMREELKKVK